MLLEKLLANVENEECVYGRPSPAYTRMPRMCAVIFAPLGAALALFGCSGSLRVFLFLACLNTMKSNGIIRDFLCVKAAEINNKGHQEEAMHVATFALATRPMPLLRVSQLWQFVRGVAMLALVCK